MASRWQTIPAALLAACWVQTVDLRSPPGDPACTLGERTNPATGICEPCMATEPPPEEACLCAFEFLPRDFPFCAVRADYRCLPCTGDKTACQAYDPESGSVRDCESFTACCQQLAAEPGSSPCCPPSFDLVCTPPDNGFECRSCCQGNSCMGANDCEDWQTCDNGRCRPACHPEQEYCDSGTCTCQPGTPPG